MTVEDLIKLHEGTRALPYRDSVGKLTIGVGVNLDAGLFPEEIEWLLQNRLRRCADDLATIFVDYDLTLPRWAALTDMRFEMGPAGFREFRHMIAAVQAGQWEDAARYALESKWATQVPSRAKMDAAMLASGEWPQT